MNKDPDFYLPDSKRRRDPSWSWIKKQKAKGLATQDYLDLWAELGGKYLNYEAHCEHLRGMNNPYVICQTSKGHHLLY